MHPDDRKATSLVRFALDAWAGREREGG
jgi:hypothetical protein